MARRAVALIGSLAVALSLTLALSAGISAAQADPAAACYPPPCAAPAPTVVHSGSDSDASLLISARSTGQRTAAPLVAVGLAMVTTMLTVVCVRRRAAMAVVAAAPAPAAVSDHVASRATSAGVRYPWVVRAPERSLR